MCLEKCEGEEPPVSMILIKEGLFLKPQFGQSSDCVGEFGEVAIMNRVLRLAGIATGSGGSRLA